MQICSVCETQMAQLRSKRGEPTLRRHGLFKPPAGAAQSSSGWLGKSICFMAVSLFLYLWEWSGNPLYYSLSKQSFCQCFLQPSTELWALVDCIIYWRVCSVWMQWGCMFSDGDVYRIIGVLWRVAVRVLQDGRSIFLLEWRVTRLMS